MFIRKHKKCLSLKQTEKESDHTDLKLKYVIRKKTSNYERLKVMKTISHVHFKHL